MEFSNNLRRILSERNLKQSDLCRMTGIPSSLMSYYFAGKKSPAIGNAVAIADALHISLDTLVGKDADETPISKTTMALYSEIEKLREADKLFFLDVLKAFNQRYK